MNYGRSTIGLHCSLLLAVLVAGRVSAAPNPPKGGWVNEQPADRVQLECGRRNPIFYVGQEIAFTVKGPSADRFEVRNYWGDVVAKGPVKSAAVGVEKQPPGWYKLYVYGKPLAGSGRPVGEKGIDA